MNYFQLIGDIMHLISILILLIQIDVTKSCAGISLKTQVLYFVVFAARYAHMFTKWVSWYTFIMKLFFLGTSAFIIYQMYFIYKDTYDHTQDNFKAEFLLLISNLRIFSLFLEAVAILPQLFLSIRTVEAKTIATRYLAALGSYRAFYILNWIYKYMNNDKVHWYAWYTGIVQLLMKNMFKLSA
ncbi:ER lumen protein retaining receptor [Conidiobolus coronatus NRRL 28638]|uniref:ER lumen protein-retaining receptor n=1 Tax=Conidiobolus coronatus (strain ATCC 28846 / CBS 209.66 / NRRL 28638) TaxID=796925 RepID=A0A137NTC4_CONC2|nr:ER lumen protein retaining receptor [Conidiobolus coronatus NRRL 28638]|eukprot:KXN65979.1 ER lumen protein retaining receptor [Conidiobolus coronatus NRRL 28638]